MQQTIFARLKETHAPSTVSLEVGCCLELRPTGKRQLPFSGSLTPTTNLLKLPNPNFMLLLQYNKYTGCCSLGRNLPEKVQKGLQSSYNYWNLGEERVMQEEGSCLPLALYISTRPAAPRAEGPRTLPDHTRARSHGKRSTSPVLFRLKPFSFVRSPPLKSFYFSPNLANIDGEVAPSLVPGSRTRLAPCYDSVWELADNPPRRAPLPNCYWTWTDNWNNLYVRTGRFIREAL